MQAKGVIALVDGEHHPSAMREALDRIERPLAGVIFCGGEEKLEPGSLEDHYGRAVETDPEMALARLAPDAAAVVDLSDEPVVHAGRRLRLAAIALHHGLAYEAPGMRLEPPRYERVSFDGPKLAVIGTGKRTGKTAVAGHWAELLRERGARPAMVCMGRGGPADPRVARPDTALDDLLAIADAGDHAASDYLEDAVLAGVPTVGCRRVGGGPAGEPAESNVAEGAAVAAGLEPGTILVEGSGAAIPPVEVDRTVCVAGAGPADPFREYRFLRADLVLVAEGADAPPGADTLRFALRPEPAEALPEGARVALFTTAARECRGVDPVVISSNLARREDLAADLDRAAGEGCDVYLTELKAAAIDTVARRARDEGARVVFVRNRPVGLDGDLEAALVKLWSDAA
jgi:cyclic 2,3-diphosphoglycerate synthase